MIIDFASVVISYASVITVHNSSYLFEVRYVVLAALFLLITAIPKAVRFTDQRYDLSAISMVGETFVIAAVFVFVAGATAFLFKDAFYSRSVVFLFPGVFFSLSSVFKVILIKQVLGGKSSGQVFRVLFIVPAEKINKIVDETPGELHGMSIEAFFLTDSSDNIYQDSNVLNFSSDTTMGLSQIIVENEISEIFADFEFCTKNNLDSIIESAESVSVRIHLSIDSPELQRYGLRIEKLPGVVMMTTPHLPLDNSLNFSVKRLFDVVFSTFVLIGFSWLYLLIAILIKIDSPGPVFFHPRRVGYSNKIFLCHKFRSMIVTPPEIHEVTSTTLGDPRITRVGRYLRKTNLDELPQFWNVFIGEMSVVGPRPHRVQLDAELKLSYERYKVRHYYKPGVSGWSQVNGLRGSMDTEESRRSRVESDLWYLENWTIFLDIKIVIMTIFSYNSWKNVT